MRNMVDARTVQTIIEEWIGEGGQPYVTFNESLQRAWQRCKTQDRISILVADKLLCAIGWPWRLNDVPEYRKVTSE